MLDITNLKAGYGPVEILYGIDVQVGEGEVVAVLRSKGVGKTTLNNVVSGLIQPTSGSIVFDGVDISRESSTDSVAMGLAHVPEGRRVFPDLSVHENLELG